MTPELVRKLIEYIIGGVIAMATSLMVIKTTVTELRVEVTNIKEDVQEIKSDVKDLRNYMIEQRGNNRGGD